MFLIVGLGNPGQKYKDSRHNIGSELVEELRSFNLEKVILQKPQMFMNQSGKAVRISLRKYKLEPNNLIIIHDDIDLPLGRIRIAKNRGSAGHKGVESVIKELGTKNFIRLRIGILPKSGKPKNPEKFVLQKFNKEEKEVVESAMKEIAEAIEFFLKEGLEKAMAKYNR